MANKKQTPSETPDESSELVKRIDSMLNTEMPDASTEPIAAPIKISLKEPVVEAVPKTAAADLPSAPSVPAALLKSIKTKDTYAEPVEPKTPLKIQVDGSPVSKDVDAQPVLEVPGLPTELEETAIAETSEVEPDVIPLDDKATDKAVDDIVAHEGDTILALEDAKNARLKNQVPKKSGWKTKLDGFLKTKKGWAIIIIGLMVIVLAVPQTRYTLLGLVIKKNVAVSVRDSKTSTPISNATVSIGNVTAKTNADGIADVKAPLGKHDMVVTKQYYRDSTSSYFVGFTAPKTPAVELTATGRLVPVTVHNKITGKPIANARITVLKTTVKTNAQGQASVALPADATSYAAYLSLAGYNNLESKIQVTDKAVIQNEFKLTPSGQVYFLSNASGSLDVVKTNLDGTDRKTVLEGTGKEDPNTTSLLASRDWRYVVLKARRDLSRPALYLIDTTTGKITTFDQSDSDFTLIGWYDHSFIYKQALNDKSSWQAGSQVIKSYDAARLQPNQLDQNQAEGNSASFAYQDFSNFYIQDNAVVYSTQWQSYGSDLTYDLSAKNDTIRAVQPNGQNKKDYYSMPTTKVGAIEAALYEPQGIYYAFRDANSYSQVSYFEYEDQAVKAVTIDRSEFGKTYPTFLLSPAGTKTFWTELRDGKNTLFTGNANADNKKQIASASQYAPYGWYSEDYLLVSKSSSELYIMANAPLSDRQPPLKISDYYKPPQSYQGYGYGYGGL